MLFLSKVQAALEEKKTQLQQLKTQKRDTLQLLLKALRDAQDQGREQFNAAVKEAPESFGGMLLLEDFSGSGWTKKVTPPFSDQSSVKRWKEEILHRRITGAVDGSQIFPDKNINLFCGALQIGWYLNHHCNPAKAVKDCDFSLELFPEEHWADTTTQLRLLERERFRREVDKLCELLEQLNQTVSPQGKMPLLFFDGSFTFALAGPSENRRHHWPTLQRLLETSRRTHIPVLAYVDTALSTQVSNSLCAALGLHPSTSCPDTHLFSHLLADWGSRTIAGQYLDKSGEAPFIPEIGFCYLKTSSQRTIPARIEFPLWIAEEGLLDSVLSVVLAECLVAKGYPYPLEVADAIAVLQKPEKEIFYRYLQQYSPLKLALSQKLASKQQRRRATVKI